MHSTLSVRSRPWLLAGGWYALLTVAVTWPLILSPASVLGALHGPGDPYLNLWILGWDLTTISRAPLDLLTGRVFDANVFHPARQTLAYSDHLTVVALPAWPLYVLTGSVTVCYNAVLLGSLFGSALAMHAFARTVTGSHWGAVAAGTIWGFWPYRLAHLEHLQLQALYAMPLAWLCLHRFVAGARRRDAVALGAAMAFQAATSVYYGVIGSVGLVAAFVALVVTTGGRRAGRLVRRGLIAGVVGAVLVAPFVWPYWQAQRREGFTRNLYEASRHAATGASYLSVPPSNALYGATGWLATDRGPEAAVFPGLGACLLAGVGALLARRRGNWPLAAASMAVAATGVALSLGPDGLRPLYATLHEWVFGFQAIRAPARFAVLVTFGLASLAAIAVRELEPPDDAARGRRDGAAVRGTGAAGRRVCKRSASVRGRAARLHSRRPLAGRDEGAGRRHPAAARDRPRKHPGDGGLARASPSARQWLQRPAAVLLQRRRGCDGRLPVDRVDVDAEGPRGPLHCLAPAGGRGRMAARRARQRGGSRAWHALDLRARLVARCRGEAG